MSCVNMTPLIVSSEQQGTLTSVICIDTSETVLRLITVAVAMYPVGVKIVVAAT